MRRLAITILIAPFVGLAGLSLLSPSAHASTPPTTGGTGTANILNATTQFNLNGNRTIVFK